MQIFHISVHDGVLQSVSLSTKKSANLQALLDAVRQVVLKEVDAHPPLRTLVEHKAFLRSWLPTVCRHVNFALDVFSWMNVFIDGCVQEELFARGTFSVFVR